MIQNDSYGIREAGFYSHALCRRLHGGKTAREQCPEEREATVDLELPKMRLMT